MKSANTRSLLVAGATGIGAMLTLQLANATDGASPARKSAAHPDLNGVWVSDEIGFVNPQRGADGSVLCIVGCPPPKTDEAKSGEGAAAKPAAPPRQPPSRPKYKPEFVAKVKELSDKQVTLDPALRCGNPGLPRIGPPDAIVQTPAQVVMLYQDLNGSFFRMIPTDGRPHRADAEETPLGDSVGKWEGDTLVIDTRKVLEDTWLTDNGAFHTAGLRITERLHRNGDKLEYQVVADDPAVLAEPWQVRPRVMKLSDKAIADPLPCVEQDLDHVVDGTHHDNAR